MHLKKILATVLFLVACGHGVPARAAAVRPALTSHVPAAVRDLSALEEVAGETPLRLAIALPGRDPVGLAATLRELADPAGPRYRKYLSPAEFGARFGAAPADLAAVEDFARTNGLTVTTRHANRHVLSLVGPARNVAAALHVRLNWYPHPTESRRFFAPDREPGLALSTSVLHIGGLDNFALPRPHLHSASLAAPAGVQPRVGSGPSGSLMGGDFRAAYVPGSPLTGAGQSVALVEFDAYYPADISAYLAATGLPPVNLVNLPVAGGVAVPGAGNNEVCLDIEVAVAMAPGLANLFVYEAPQGCPWLTILSQIADDNLARSVSCSWYGGSENPAAELVFQQMAAQGQSFFNASGDSDAYTGAIPFPEDSPNIVQVGGTTLTTDASGAYVSETAWNWGHGVGSGGGVSTYFPLPAYQQGVASPGNSGSATHRNVPDVAMVADNILIYCGNGLRGRVGGTSAAAPLWAAFAALVNQQADFLGLPPLGFPNPAFYALGAGPAYGVEFHDVTTGNNTSPSSPRAFLAGAGYDLATGWGSPNGTNLINVLAGGGLNFAAAPVFTPAGGGFYTNPVVAIVSPTPGAAIRYTLDGSLPSASQGILYTGPLTVTSNTVLNAVAYDGVGFYSVATRASYSLLPCWPPGFTNQPVDLAVCAGKTAAFAAGAIGTGLSCQWQLDAGSGFTNLSGATRAVYVTPALTVGSSGNQYQCVAFGACGAATSAVASVTVYPNPSAFVSGGGAFCSGSAVLVQADLAGTAPWQVTWSDGVIQTGVATSPAQRWVNPAMPATYQVTALQDADCVASGAQLTGRATANPGLAPGFTLHPVGLTVCPGSTVRLVTAALGTSLAYQWQAGLAGNGFTNVPGATSAAYTVSGLAAGPRAIQYRCVATGPCGAATSHVAIVTVLAQPGALVSGSGAFCPGGAATIQAALTGTAPWQVTWSDGFVQAGVTTTPAVRSVSPGTATTYKIKALSDANCTAPAAQLTGSAIVTPNSAPTFTRLPVDSSACAGGTVTFAAAATGTGVGYQWWVAPAGAGFTPLAGATKAAYTTPGLTVASQGAQYYCVAAGACGAATSAVATLTVHPRPTAIVSGGGTICAGGALVVQAALSGTAPWQVTWSDGAVQSGVPASPLLRTVTPAAGVTYTIKALADASCAAQSADLTGKAVVAVTTPPVIVTPPASWMGPAGGSVTLTVGATGAAPLGYQWLFNGAPLAGATQTSCRLLDLAPGQTGAYAVSVSNLCGTTLSAAANVLVTNCPLPTPWLALDVGPVGWVGNQCWNSASWTLEGSGAAMNGTADQCHYVYQTITGDGSIQAQLLSQSGTAATALAGLMIRETTAAGAREVWVARAGTGVILVRTRAATGANPTSTVGTTVALPNCWLRLVRTGTLVTSALSPDGSTWTTLGTATVPIAANATIGFFSTSGSNTTVATDVWAPVLVVP